MSIVSPGRLFLEKQKTISTFEDVLAYAEFFTQRSRLGRQPSC